MDCWQTLEFKREGPSVFDRVLHLRPEVLLDVLHFSFLFNGLDLLLDELYLLVMARTVHSRLNIVFDLILGQLLQLLHLKSVDLPVGLGLVLASFFGETSDG